jgi:hypothetical protein
MNFGLVGRGDEHQYSLLKCTDIKRGEAPGSGKENTEL